MAKVDVTNKGYLAQFVAQTLNFRPKNLSKKRLLYNYFPVDFANLSEGLFYRTPTWKRRETSLKAQSSKFKKN